MNRIAFIHYLRGLAALSVLFAHLCGAFWLYAPLFGQMFGAPYPLEARPVLFPTAMVAQFGLGLFFAISGFVIPLSLEHRSRLNFAFGRFFRLWPTYVAGVLTVVAIRWLVTDYFDAPFGVTFEQVRNQLALGAGSYLNKSDLVGVTWTLEVEMIFYGVCALIASALRQRNVRTLFLISLALMAIAVWLKATGVPASMAWSLQSSLAVIPLMFMGTLLYYHYRGHLSLGRLMVLLAAMTLIFATTRALRATDFVSWQTVPYLAGFAAMALCYAIARGWKSRTAFFFADISYPLYVVHSVGGYGVMIFVMSFGAPFAIALLAAIAYAITAATLIHFLVEKPSMRLGPKFIDWASAQLASSLRAVREPRKSQVLVER